MGIQQTSPCSGRRKLRAAVDLVIFANHLEYNIARHHHRQQHHDEEQQHQHHTKGAPAAAAATALEDETETTTLSATSHREDEEGGDALRRKFRAAVAFVVWSRRVESRVVARRRFRAAIDVLRYSSNLFETEDGVRCDLKTLQDAVRTIIAVRKLQNAAVSPPTTIGEPQQRSHAKMDLSGKEKLKSACWAVMALNGLKRDINKKKERIETGRDDEPKEVVSQFQAAADAAVCINKSLESSFLLGSRAHRRAFDAFVERQRALVEARRRLGAAEEAVECVNRALEADHILGTRSHKRAFDKFLEEHGGGGARSDSKWKQD